uniref:Uncharacterized protein n=1 Tax=Octopus bimaculoides TaxID=37653 RepID=A0A0L8HJ90_OCTBM
MCLTKLQATSPLVCMSVCVAAYPVESPPCLSVCLLPIYPSLRLYAISSFDPPVCRSVYHSLSLLVYSSIYLSNSESLYVSIHPPNLPVDPFACKSILFCLAMFLYPSAHLTISLPLCQSVCPPVIVYVLSSYFIHPSSSPSVCLFVCPLDYMFCLAIFISIHSFVRPSVHSSIHHVSGVTSS